MTRSTRPSFSAAAALLCALASVGYATAAGGEAALDQRAMASGFATVEAACFACHSPDANPETRIAPPMSAVKQRYLRMSPDYGRFRDALVRFVKDPSAENARMPGAVAKFGVMPKLAFDDAVLSDVAYYVYHTELEKPAWFARHYAAEKARYGAAGTAALRTPEDYRRHGQRLAMQTKTELGSKLKRALQEGGPEGAVSFCSTRAGPIAEAMSSKLGATITRVSDRPRNPGNAANADELAAIGQFRDALAGGEDPGSAIREFEDHMVGYYPIVTNGMCLQCHGSVDRDIAPGTQALIREKYPQDQATGYGVNQLRGIFVVRMDKPDQVPEAAQ